jgi:CRISPR/Cas system CSM-associated protein Csm4 (group 5 of RAMP superfamily)
MTYFEKTYLQKNQTNISVKESKRLQKLLSAKAFACSADSKRLSTADLKKMMKPKTSPGLNFNVDSYIHPFDMI